MKGETVLFKSRLGLLLHAPEDQLRGGIRMFAQYLQLAFPQLEIFPRPEWPAQHLLTRRNFKIWYLNWLKNDFFYVRSLLKLHKERPFDLLFTLSSTGLSLTAERLRIPVINLYLGCFSEFISQTVQNRWDAFVQRVIAGTMDKMSGRGKCCTVISEQVKNEIKERYGLDCLVIPLGVDLNPTLLQDKKEVRRQLKLAEGLPIGLFMGPAQFAKGWDIVLETARALPEITFVCVTDASFVPGSIKNIILKKNTMSKEDQNKWYNAADFFFFPSRYESGAYVVLEAMSFNLPVIISHGTGSIIFGASVLSSKEGVYIIDNENQDYAEAIQACLKNRTLPQTRAFVEKNRSLEQFCEKHRQLVVDLITKQKTPQAYIHPLVLHKTPMGIQSPSNPSAPRTGKKEQPWNEGDETQRRKS